MTKNGGEAYGKGKKKIKKSGGEGLSSILCWTVKKTGGEGAGWKGNHPNWVATSSGTREANC